MDKIITKCPSCFLTLASRHYTVRWNVFIPWLLLVFIFVFDFWNKVLLHILSWLTNLQENTLSLLLLLLLLLCLCTWACGWESVTCLCDCVTARGKLFGVTCSPSLPSHWFPHGTLVVTIPLVQTAFTQLSHVVKGTVALPLHRVSSNCYSPSITAL